MFGTRTAVPDARAVTSVSTANPTSAGYDGSGAGAGAGAGAPITGVAKDDAAERGGTDGHSTDAGTLADHVAAAPNVSYRIISQMLPKYLLTNWGLVRDPLPWI